MNPERHCLNITRVADHFGFDAQAHKTVEELGELLAELGRLMSGAETESLEHLLEEIADVYNMLDQLCYLLKIQETVGEVAAQKMERTIEKIKNEPPQIYVDVSRERFEEICENVHNGWWAEKIDQGVTDHPDMIPYDQLSESVKNYDRVTVRPL